jgi:hypothetical protein
MSLGCGAYAGNITSDNITPLHLMNVKRLAYERRRDEPVSAASAPALPVSPPPPAPAPPPPPPAPAPAPVVDFVSEDDVRRALREGRTIRLARRAIVTPAAREAAEGRGVLIAD